MNHQCSSPLGRLRPPLCQVPPNMRVENAVVNRPRVVLGAATEGCSSPVSLPCSWSSKQENNRRFLHLCNGFEFHMTLRSLRLKHSTLPRWRVYIWTGQSQTQLVMNLLHLSLLPRQTEPPNKRQDGAVGLAVYLAVLSSLRVFTVCVPAAVCFAYLVARIIRPGLITKGLI